MLAIRFPGGGGGRRALVPNGPRKTRERVVERDPLGSLSLNGRSLASRMNFFPLQAV
jgi:hypothetical protein